MPTPVLRVPKAAAVDVPLRSSNPDATRLSSDALFFNALLPAMYQIRPAASACAPQPEASCVAPPPNHATLTAPPPPLDVDFLNSLSPESFLLPTNVETVQLIEKTAMGYHFFSDLEASLAL